MNIRALRESGVLGINGRNADLVAKHNPRRLYPLVDDKLRSKQLAIEHGVPVPELYGSLSTIREIREFPDLVRGLQDFVITRTDAFAPVPACWCRRTKCPTTWPMR
jgi:hypothetical protein